MTQTARPASDCHSSLSTILERFCELDWEDRGKAHLRAQQEFTEVNVPSLLRDLKQQSQTSISVGRSVEKTTHYKWFLGEGPDRDFELWLHEYKPRRLRRPGHATVAHNHRFWLTSLILRGGFTDTRYARVEGEGEPLIKPVAQRSMDLGNTMVIDPEEIHSLAALQDKTISLVVQSRPVRSYSEVFEEGEVRRYFDLEAKLAELRESL